MPGPLNSPVSDASPFEPPKTKKPKKAPDSDWAALGKSGQYPSINQWIESRKEHFRRYLPGGGLISDLKDKEKIAAWDRAVLMIGEYEDFQNKIATEVVASKTKGIGGGV